MTFDSNQSNQKFTVFLPCGKCYACRCASRAEWALRMREEFKDVRNVSSYFLTLTYDDDNLPCVGYNTKTLLDYYKTRPISERNYWFSVLRKEHFMDFLQRLKNWFRLYFCKPVKYKHPHNNEFSDTFKSNWIPIYDDNSLPRYYLTGEYGDISNRCHGHLIVWFTKEVHASDIEMFSKDLWQYGNLQVESHISAAARNYVAKHQVKDCVGTPFQNAYAPIFCLSSRYRGGIGRILKNDYNMKRIFLQSLRSGDTSDCYYTNIQSSVVYKIPIPRFLKKSWHEEKLDDVEFSILSHNSLKKFKEYITTCLIDQNDFTLYNQFLQVYKTSICQGSNDTLARITYKLSRKYVARDKERFELYRRKKRNSKLQKLVNSSNYSHI